MNKKLWEVTVKTPSQLELNAIRNLLIPLAYTRIKVLIEKINKKHCE